MGINPNFIHEEQNFKLVYGSVNAIWENAELDESVDRDALKDGLWLAKNELGKWEPATDTALAFPILEMKYQYDSMAVNSVTVARGVVPAITKIFAYDDEDEGYPTSAEVGQLLKTKDGVLVPVAEDGSEDALHVAIIEEVYPDRLLIIKRY